MAGVYLKRECFVQLTAAVGVDKTILCRAMLDQLGKNFCMENNV